MKLNLEETKVSDSTNILNINIPPEMRIRHRSSIDWINDAFAGGWVASQVTMLTGDPGAGKTTMVLQLADSLTASGHTVLYNTREESLIQIAIKMEDLRLKSGFVPSEHRRVTELLVQANKMKKRNPQRQIFLFQDSLPTLDDGFYRDGAMNSRTPERACLMLTEWAKANKAIVIFINHVTKNNQFVGKNTVKHAIDTHAHLRIDKKTGYRHFNVEKNRMGANYDTYVVGLGPNGLSLINKIALSGSPKKRSKNDNVIELEPRRNRRRKERP